MERETFVLMSTNNKATETKLIVRDFDLMMMDDETVRVKDLVGATRANQSPIDRWYNKPTTKLFAEPKTNKLIRS